MNEDKTFLGTGWGFPPTFDRSFGVLMVTDEEDIRQSLHILLHTSPGERIMNPTFGCALRDRIFDNYTASFEAQVKRAIREAILYFEPRIVLEEILLDNSRWVDGIVDIKLYYTIIVTNSRSNMVFPFYIEEGTNIPDRNMSTAG
ncbi:GPW/gp25 family protein [soil metagenome]